MNPLELRVAELERKLQAIQRAEDIQFINMLRNVFRPRVTLQDLPAIKLSDLSDVDGTDSASTGQVLKKTSTTWQPGTDNT